MSTHRRYLIVYFAAFGALLIAGLARGAAAQDASAATATLERRCIHCHSAAEPKGNLSLVTRDSALAGGDSGASLVPGKPEGSLLIDFVTGDKPEMPKQGPPLSQEEVNVLRAWIKDGAAWPTGRALVDRSLADLDWWSLRPLVAPSVPAPLTASNISHASIRLHPVDAFVDAKLAELQLRAAPPADPATLVRRLTFDLTGLPPTPDDVAAFQRQWESSANHDEAYGALVDRLLDSPALGEKWAQHWLDLARYAETHGYDKDKPRETAWPYRDYVIRSLNADKPYSRFVQEQIAGDAMFPGEPNGVLGLGFLAAGPWDFIGHSEVGEGKVDGRIAKHVDRDEMISAIFNVFLSTTVQCAQCHHHKFDPLRMEDYYRLHAVFAAVDRAERTYAGLTPELERQRQSLTAEASELKAERDRLDSDLNRVIAGKTSALDRRIAELKEKHATAPKPQFGWHSAVSREQDAEKWVQVDLGEPRRVRQVRLIPAHDNFNNIGAGFGFPVRYKVEASNDSTVSQSVHRLHDATAADQPNPKENAVLIDAPDVAARYLRITATRLAPRKNDYIFALGELEVLAEGESTNVARGATVTAFDSIEAPPRWGRANLTDGIFYGELNDSGALAELRQLEKERQAIVAALTPPETTARLSAIDQQTKALAEQLEKIPKGEVVYAAATEFAAQGRFIATGGKPRPIHLLARGDIRAPREVMRPGMPPLWSGADAEFTLAADASEADARAALATAIASRDNPLLWRSIANRVWQWTMGQPLVGSPNDFGRMGQQPTHPELLDWLAVQLRDDHQQSLKSIIRLLVTSRAYRRSSGHDAANAKRDADNRYYWRAPRRRLTAEEFRDALLSVSGKLRLEPRGGKSFQDFVIEKPQHSPHYEYALHDPNDPAAQRRTIYRFVVRSQPQPFLMSLDCADPSLSVPRREESTTALQALAQWNDRLVEAMARQFAERLQREAQAPESRVDLACRLALGRLPTASEREALVSHLNCHGPTSLARVVFNLSAFVYLD